MTRLIDADALLADLNTDRQRHEKYIIDLITNAPTIEADSGEAVAFVITDEKINYLQKNTIKRLIDRAKHAHMTDIKLRINGKDEWYEADWIKYMEIASPPKREWRGLSDEQINECWDIGKGKFTDIAKAIEAKLKDLNHG